MEKLSLKQAQDLVAEYAPSPYYVDEYRAMEDHYLPHLCALLDQHVPGSVVEIGPGWGTMAVWLASRGWDVHCVDHMSLGHFISGYLLGAVDIRGGSIDYLTEDIEEPGQGILDLGAHPLVLMTQVIPHLRWRPTGALRNCRALLADGGLFITTALDAAAYPNIHPPHGTDWRSIPEWYEGGERPNFAQAMEMCMYSRATLEGLLREVFVKVNVWRPEGSTVLFATCRP
jgi:hypothetical protein